MENIKLKIDPDGSAIVLPGYSWLLLPDGTEFKISFDPTRKALVITKRVRSESENIEVLDLGISNKICIK